MAEVIYGYECGVRKTDVSERTTKGPEDLRTRQQRFTHCGNEECNCVGGVTLCWRNGGPMVNEIFTLLADN